MTEYDAYPDHPLAGTDQSVLDTARAALGKCSDADLTDPDDVDAVADAIVLALVERGHVVLPTAPRELPRGMRTFLVVAMAICVLGMLACLWVVLATLPTR